VRKFTTLIIVLILVIGFIYVLAQNSNRALKMPPPKPFHKLSYIGSIGTGKDKVRKGISSFKQNYQKLDTVSLGWYNLDFDNEISLDSSVSNEIEADTIAFAKQNAKKIIFGISDHGEAEKADDILEDWDDQQDHISNVISIIDEKGYDGVIIDYEDMRNEQEEDFTKYMRKLSEEIRSKGKTLGISIPVETQGKVSHGINIANVSKVVDSMHMNVYEEHGQDSAPGPIASIEWTNTVIKNIIDQGAKPNKIVLGTAHSGHDWIVKPEEEFFKDMATNETLELLQRTKGQLQWDEEKQANYFGYKDEDDRKHIVWLEDARSFKAKIDLAKAYQLQGIFIWFLGGEDPKVWEVL
jgi:spore germination protein YaaH